MGCLTVKQCCDELRETQRFEFFPCEADSQVIRTFLKAVCLECFVFNVLAIAATLNDPATSDTCVRVSRQM